ncbi:hypothetical protein GCM10027521_37850 [Amycolatopsis cihanbeyliensis]
MQFSQGQREGGEELLATGKPARGVDDAAVAADDVEVQIGGGIDLILYLALCRALGFGLVAGFRAGGDERLREVAARRALGHDLQLGSIA